MNLKEVKNKASRNGFDLSTKRNFSAKVGELLPVYVREVLPADRFDIDLKSLIRTQPLNTAAFARMRYYYDFYFVPYEVLWRFADTVLSQMNDNQHHSINRDPSLNKLTTSRVPYITCKTIATYLRSLADHYHDQPDISRTIFGTSRSLASAKLLEYLGYGNFYNYARHSSSSGKPAAPSDQWSTNPQISNLSMNLFPMLAYQKIYSDYYRDTQWEKFNPSIFNVDWMLGNSEPVFSESYLDANFKSYSNFFDLRYCNWNKDLFHGVLPNQQFGSTSVVSITSAINPDKTEAAGELSVIALRQAEALQRYKEVAMSVSQNYKDQIEAHWNVKVSGDYGDTCKYLGGIDGNLDINEVVNTNITGENEAEIAGKGVGVSNGKVTFESSGQYGVLMCIFHCAPLIDYTTNGVDKFVTRVNATDFAIPELDNIGMESLPSELLTNKRIQSETQSKYNSPFIIGYVPRYIDYKTDIDKSIGAFKSSLSNWIISYSDTTVYNGINSESNPMGTTLPTIPLNAVIDYTFLKVNPASVNPLFGVAAGDDVDTDQLLASTFFDVKAVRNLDVNGLPY